MTTHIALSLDDSFRKLDGEPSKNPTPAIILATDLQLSHKVPVEVPGGISYSSQRSFAHKIFGSTDGNTLYAVAGSINDQFLELRRSIMEGTSKLDINKDIKKGLSSIVRDYEYSAMSTPGPELDIGKRFILSVANRNNGKLGLYQIFETGVIVPKNEIFAGSGGPFAEKSYTTSTSNLDNVPAYCKTVLEAEIALLTRALDYAKKDQASLGQDIRIMLPDKTVDFTAPIAKKEAAYSKKVFMGAVKSLKDLEPKD
jgi:hypothetical protein